MLDYRASSDTSLTEFGLPEVIEIEPIHTCNLRCIMCHVTYEELSKVRIDVDATLRSLACLKGTAKWVTVGSMYEPAAHPRFGDLIVGLSDLGFKIDVTTNGTLFTPELNRRLAGCNLANVTISFDGIRKETYEGIRGRADYERALERILGFKESVTSPQTYFTINNTIMRRNVDEISEAVDFWEQAGFDHMGLIMMVLRDRNEMLLAESPEPIMEHVHEKLDEAARRVLDGNYRIVLSSSGYTTSKLRQEYPAEHFEGSTVKSANPLAQLPYNARTHYQNGYYPGMSVDCRSPFKFARILYNGDLQLCYQFKIGSVNDHEFLDMWNGERAKKVRATVLKSAEVCLSCDYYRFCIKAGEVDLEKKDNFVNATTLVRFSEPTLIESFSGCNIVAWQDSFFSLGHEIGHLDLKIDDLSQYHGVFIDDSPDRLKRLALARERFLSERKPALAEECGNEFNIISWMGRYMLMPRWHGPIDILADDLTRFAGTYICGSIEEARGLARQHLEDPNTLTHHLDRVQQFIRDRHLVPVGEFHGFTIYRWFGQHIAAPTILAPYDFTNDLAEKLMGIAVSETLASVTELAGLSSTVRSWQRRPSEVLSSAVPYAV